jgi:hypothetical protein
MTAFYIIGTIVIYLVVGFLIDAMMVNSGILCTSDDSKALAILMLLWIIILPLAIIYIIWCGILRLLEEFEK